MSIALTWITDSVAGQSPPVDPSQPAVCLDDVDTLSWAELRDAELGVARALLGAGVKHGDRVGMLMKNSIDYVVLYLAIARVGAIAVRLNWRLTSSELAFIVEDAEVSLLVCDSEYADQVSSIQTALPDLRVVASSREGAITGSSSQTWDEFLSAQSEQDFPRVSPDDPVSLIYTSGTTGRPKGVIWTHRATLAFCMMQSMRWKYDSHTVAMTPGPLFHVGGLEAVFLPALVTHGTAVTFSSGGFDLKRLLDVAQRRHVSMLLLYSFMVYDLVRLETVREVIPTSLRQVVTGGDTLQPWSIPEFAKYVPEVELLQVYGSSESGAISTCLDHEFAHERAGSVGRPMPLTEIRVVDTEGAEVPNGQVGEVCVRGLNTSQGYWRRDDATAETFQDGWCRTGDLGRLDEGGFLYLTGRVKDMIRSGGENVYPAEVEAVLTTAPNVADAAVFGLPDPRYSEVGCALLVPVAGSRIDVEEVRTWCASRLARYKIPRHFLIEDDLPRTASGKVKKFELRERYAKLEFDGAEAVSS